MGVIYEVSSLLHLKGEYGKDILLPLLLHINEGLWELYKITYTIASEWRLQERYMR